MTMSFEMATLLPAAPERVYNAWLSADEHSAFTGSPATVDPTVGGAFTAWDGYISGTTLEMTPTSRIVQAWRSTDFPESAPDSRLEIRFEAAPEGTRLTLIHSGFPEGSDDEYRQGWIDFYFAPMAEYFTADE